MKQLSKRLTYANVMSSLAVFLVVGGATAFAATQLPKNSVGKKQLKSNSVTTAKIKKNAVTTAKLKNGAVTGAKVNLSTLGTVPSANTANTANSANSLAGQTSFFIRLNFGQQQTIASNGSVSLVADCYQESGTDYIRILEQTTQNGAVAGGDDNWEGGSSPSDFLNVDTPANQRELVEESETSGETYVYADIDQGFVIGPDSKGLTTNSEGIALGLNYRSPGCLVAGVVNAIG